jgi:hypothetical protein
VTGGDLRADWTTHFDAAGLQRDRARRRCHGRTRDADRRVCQLGGELRATREVDDSFALVGSIPDVQVFLENQPVARTDEHGFALIRICGRTGERISVDPARLPIDTDRAAMVSPAFRSARRSLRAAT